VPTRQRSAWRRYWQRSQAMRIAVPIAIPAALALVLGTAAAPAAASPTATASAHVASAHAAKSVPPHPDLAFHAVDPTGNKINLGQTPAQAANSLNCTLVVPDNALTAKGLATPWLLGDGCSQANPNEEAFVEATILAPNGQLQVYAPLVITRGTRPAVWPKPPVIAPGSQVIIDTGFNGNNLVLQGPEAYESKCVDAIANSVIAQTAACNYTAFYQMANKEIAAGTLKVPALATGSDGKQCENTESFSLIDQDQSDNVVSRYLLKGDGQTAQNTPANESAMGGATVIVNGSDDGLLAHFVDPALGCTPFTAPDTTAASTSEASQALNALSARQNPNAMRALLPVNDPQLLVNGKFSLVKTNAYRAMVDEGPLSANQNGNWNAAVYCQDMVNTAPARLKLDFSKEVGFTSPVPATGNNLATFMGARLAASFTNLNCQNFGLKDPVTVTVNGQGVAVAVSYRIFQQKAKVPPGTSAGGPGGSGYNTQVPAGRSTSNHRENGAGM
jgi:hypothetical protein